MTDDVVDDTQGTDDFYDGPTLLGPKVENHSDRLARRLFWPLMVSLPILVILLYVAFTPLQVVGDSMFPTLHEQDRILRTKAYGTPHRGDVVIIQLGNKKTGEEIVKRIIGVAGDTIEIRDNIALVNGAVEDTGRLTLQRGTGDYFDPVTVPTNTVYVMGDNRPVSLDSRYVGVIPLSRVEGRARYVFLPLNRIRTIR